MRRVRKIHLIGIGGSGMCGIAEILIDQGYEVSGSDIKSTDITGRLKSLGAKVFIGHTEDNLQSCDVVVISSAIDEDNKEIQEAHRKHIPVVPRAEMLGELMRYRYGIAVAGTHGKTTTTSLITSIFQAADLDPTVVIGGLLNSMGSNARLGKSQYFIAEADESDASFLHLQPMLAVVTNIDRDHMATYGGDFDVLKSTFVEFVQRLPFYGAVVLCIDDENIMDLVDSLARPIITYGLSEEADFRATDISCHGLSWAFRVARPEGAKTLDLVINNPGMHNVLNALASVAVATEEGVSDEAIIAGLSNFEGVDRRFQVEEQVSFCSLVEDDRNSTAVFTLVDDYGHHPTELKVVIQTARQVWPDRRLVMAFQPHRYSRTHELYDDFVKELGGVDALLLLQVYSAGEKEIPGADSHALAQGLRDRGSLNPVYAENTEEALELLPQLLQPDDVLIVQGAGNVNQISMHLLKLQSMQQGASTCQEEVT
ncbi:MAG: UDP-N-acetylmuramate--L-alanine ligase [Pseudomonadales bacterium]|nr:UDP-N-acetylmuramate--L-alanine ligase [Pseudomonadales bacterium]